MSNTKKNKIGIGQGQTKVVISGQKSFKLQLTSKSLGPRGLLPL
jgi:hypothetical protein